MSMGDLEKPVLGPLALIGGGYISTGGSKDMRHLLSTELGGESRIRQESPEPQVGDSDFKRFLPPKNFAHRPVTDPASGICEHIVPTRKADAGQRTIHFPRRLGFHEAPETG